MFHRLNARTGGLRHRGNGGIRVSCKHFVIKRNKGSHSCKRGIGGFQHFLYICIFRILFDYNKLYMFIIILG